MDNILKYLIQLKADGGNIRQVARQTITELDQVKNSARNIGSTLREAFSFKNFSNSLMSIPGMQFLMNPYTIIGAGIGAVTKLGAEAEMTSVAFNKLVGDEQKAADTLAQIKEYANMTPYETMDLVDSAKQMMSFGIATEKSVEYMKRLGDISQGDKEKLKALSLVTAQVESAGKLQGQDLLQFINAGFNPLQVLSEETGKSMGELKDMMSKGQIGAQDVAYAIQKVTDKGGKFFGSSEEQAKTTSGKISTLMGKIADMASSAFKAIQPVVNALIDTVSWMTDNAGIVAILSAGIGALAIGANWASIMMGALSAKTAICTVAQTAFNAVMNMNPIARVIILVTTLAGAVMYCWNKFAGFRAFIITMWDTVKSFGSIIKDFLINRIKDLLSGIGELGSAMAKLFNGDFEGAWDSAKSAVTKISGAKAAGEAVARSVNTIRGINSNYNKNKATEEKKQGSGTKSNKVSSPGLVGSDYTPFQDGAGGKSTKNKGKGAKSKDASEIATGGTRNTQITMNISKFFDNLQVTMADRTDTAELETIVVQSLNRALAIATSTDR